MSDRFLIDPDAVLDYAFDWTDWLDASETIATFAVTGSAGITVGATTQASGVVTVWVSGAEPPGQLITCHITTNDGRTDDRSIELVVTDR